MIYSRHIVYSLEALGYLASQPENKRINARELAKELHIPFHYFGKVLTSLAKRKLIDSSKGPAGGFALVVKPADISIYRILEVLDGLGKLENACVMGLGQCFKQNPCAFHCLWSDFRKQTIAETQRLSLKEFSRSFTSKLQSVS